MRKFEVGRIHARLGTAQCHIKKRSLPFTVVLSLDGELKSLLLKIAANNINCQLDRGTGRVSILSNVPPGLSTLARSTHRQPGKHRGT